MTQLWPLSSFERLALKEFFVSGPIHRHRHRRVFENESLEGFFEGQARQCRSAYCTSKRPDSSDMLPRPPRERATPN
jgi:hypothetical protein